MPLIESQPDALAMIYARSLLDLAQAKGGRAAAEEMLGELEEILELARGNPRFNEFLASRAVPTAKRTASLEKVLKGRVTDTTLRFLQVINKKERLARLPSIVAAFDQLVQEKFGRVEVDVFTAEAISGEQAQRIQGRLGGILKKDVIVHPYVEVAMIGGIKLRIGDQLVDASVATRLRKLRDRFGTEGASALRERLDRMFE